MSDDSEPPIYYEYIEKKEDISYNHSNNTKIEEATKEKSSSIQNSDEEEDSDSVVIITSIKKIPPSPKLPRIIKLQDQGQVNESELETDPSQKSLDLDVDLDSESSDCPKFRTPPMDPKTLSKIPYSINRDSSSQESVNSIETFEQNKQNQQLQYISDDDESDEHVENKYVDNINDDENESDSDTMDFLLSEREKKLQERLHELRRKYLEDVQKAIKEFGIDKQHPVASISSNNPPNFEKMSNQTMEKELAKYGFRFTTRTSGISKLTRIWYALNEENSKKINDATRRTMEVSTPTDFIRLKSKYYEDILVYVPIPLRGLYREMEEYGIKCSLSKLKQILTNEGVAFLEDSSI